jgi:hypothetical protein
MGACKKAEMLWGFQIHPNILTMNAPKDSVCQTCFQKMSVFDTFGKNKKWGHTVHVYEISIK